MRFEAGTPNIADAIALGAAVDYLQALGMDNVRKHEIDLTAYALTAFKELEKSWDVYGPKDARKRGGIVSFHHPDVHPHDLGTVLDRRGIAIRTGHHCAMPMVQSLGVAATARASMYLYNTEAEIDLLVDALKEALRYFGNGLDRLDDLYRDAILDHRRNPRNRKALKSPDIVGDAINPFCGDEIHLQIGLDGDKRIARIGLQGEGLLH